MIGRLCLNMVVKFLQGSELWPISQQFNARILKFERTKLRKVAASRLYANGRPRMLCMLWNSTPPADRILRVADVGGARKKYNSIQFVRGKLFF